MGDVDHLLGDDAGAGEFVLGDGMMVATRRVRFPSPLRGGVRGGGSRTHDLSLWTPTPLACGERPSPQGGGFARGERPQRRRLVGEVAGEVLAGDVAVVLRADVAAGVFLDAAAFAHPGGADARQALLDVDGGVRVGVGAGGVVDAEGFFGRALGERDLAERHAHVGVALGRGVDLGAGADRPGGDLGDHQVFAAGDLVHVDLTYLAHRPCRKGSRPARGAPRQR